MLSNYKNKKVFITGHTGFKGGWLLAILSHLGSEIKGYALAPEYANGIYNVINGDKKCVSIIDDIRNRSKLEQEIIDFEPDFIFHLAAQPLVRASYEQPSETFEVNVMGTSYVLEAVRKLKGKCTVVIITTDKVYKNKNSNTAFVESDELGSTDPYSNSKACAELLVYSFKNSFFNINNFPEHQKAIATVRAGNVIGGGDYSKDRIIPDLITALKNNETLKIRNPFAIRPWQHVLEPLTGYLKLGLLIDKEPTKYSSAFNFGPALADHLSVEELTKEAISIWGSGKYEISSGQENQVHEEKVLKLNIELAKKELKWTPQFSARQSLELTLDWYKSNSPAQLTFSQIENYLTLLK